MASAMKSVRTTSEALSILRNNRRRDNRANVYLCIDTLTMCAKQKDLSAVKQIHDCMVKSGMDKNPLIVSTLLNAYVECGRLLDARRIFEQFEKKIVGTWNTMIRGYAKSAHVDSAMKLFKTMRREGVRPDAVTYLCILKACTSPLALEWGKEVHACIGRAGLESDVRVGTALITMYAKCGCITEARRIFDRMVNRNIITWTIMIGAYAGCGCGVEAYNLLLRMIREGFEPNVITFLSILNASASAGALEWVKKVHAHCGRAGLLSDFRVSSALINMYAKAGSIDDSRLIFEKMEICNLFTWNAMIGGLAQHGRGVEALGLFAKMSLDSVKPDQTTFVAVLSACCHAGLLEEGRRIFSAMSQDFGIKPNVVHYNCIVDLLGRAGNLEEAKLFISKMPVEPDVVTWSTLLGACRTYGYVEMGEFAATKAFELKPKASAYVTLANIYAAAGMREEESRVRSMMEKRGVRKEPGRTWIEVDNKIHEFLAGDTYHPEAKAIYAYLRTLTKKLKAEGYIPETQLVLQNAKEEDKELAICSHSEKLAIAYGLMHIPPGEPIRVQKNLRVCSDCHAATKVISKVTGREIIARDANRFHHFKGGVCSCGDYW